MYKLGALDAGFIYGETERCPQHIASVQVLELPPGTSEEEFVQQLKALLLDRIHLVPYFTNRLQRVPFDLDHPVWVKDPDFCIDNHVKSARVDEPGGRAELEKKIAEFHAVPLDRSRPLWDLWVLTGLEGGRVAYYNRAHHACLDGMAGQAMIETTMDLGPQPRAVEPAPEGFLTARDRQTPAQLVVGALENFARFQLKQPLAAMTAVETAARLFQRTFDPRRGLGAVTESAPRTRFNRGVEQGRTYATSEMSLDAVKAIAAAADCKVNDVFLSVCAGGLERYLERTGELPDKALIAGCPVSLRRPGDTSTNNQVTMMLVSLATDESDPVRRLQKVARSGQTAKGFTADIAASYDSDVSVPGMPALVSSGIRAVERGRLADLPGMRLPCNLVVSNVPGPQMPLFSCGARVLTHYPVSIPAHTQAVNITVQSYAGRLFYAITGCAKALPDAGRLRDDMNEAFVELARAHGVNATAEDVLALSPAAEAPESEAGTVGAAEGRQPAPASSEAAQVGPRDKAA